MMKLGGWRQIFIAATNRRFPNIGENNMQRVITKDTPKDYIALTKDAGSITMKNLRTGQTVTLPKDSTPNEIRLARQSLQEQVESDPLLKMPAGKAMDLLSGAPAAEVDSDPEPYVPVGGNPKSPHVQRQQKLHDEWLQRKDAKAARAQKLEDDRRIVDGITERLQPQPQPQPEPADNQHLPESFNISWEQFKAQAEANAAGGTVENI